MNNPRVHLEPISIKAPVAEFSAPWLPSMPSLPPSLPDLEDDEDARESKLPTRIRTFRAELHDRMGPLLAGALTGALAGTAALVALEVAVARMTTLSAPSAALGALIHAQTSGIAARAIAFGAAVALGSFAGAFFAALTRHLRRVAPLVIWSLIAWPAVVTVFYAFFADGVAPALRSQVPYIPALVASLVYASIVVLQLPLRRRSPLVTAS